MPPDVPPGYLSPHSEGLAARRRLIRTVTDHPLFGRARLRGKRHPGERDDTRGQPPQGCRPAQGRGREPLDQRIELGSVHDISFRMGRSGEEAGIGESTIATAHASYHYTAPNKSEASWASQSA